MLFQMSVNILLVYVDIIISASKIHASEAIYSFNSSKAQMPAINISLQFLSSFPFTFNIMSGNLKPVIKIENKKKIVYFKGCCIT